MYDGFTYLFILYQKIPFKLTKEYVESDNGEKSEIVYIKFPTEYDEDNMDMTEEEFKEMKEMYAEYLFYKKKLNDLKSLYQYKKRLLRNPFRQKRSAAQPARQTASGTEKEQI